MCRIIFMSFSMFFTVPIAFGFSPLPWQQGQLSETMPDGTISYEQPDSQPRFGFDKYEGKCGQTALANVCRMLTGDDSLRPQAAKLVNLTDDSTPGVHPLTLVKAANSLCGKKHKFFLRQAGLRNHLRSLRVAVETKGPTLALVNWDEDLHSMHWVTVVQVTSTKVIFNHWGRQDELSHSSFLSRWGSMRCTTAERAVIEQLYNCKPYTYIVASSRRMVAQLIK